MKLREYLVRLVLVATVICSNGCALFLIGAGVAIGVGTAKYVGGELQSADEVTMDRAWKASLQAMQELEFRVTKQQKDALAGEIVARRADDTRILIRFKKQSDTVTEMRIRVGTFGDEQLSRLIYEKIKSRF